MTFDAQETRSSRATPRLDTFHGRGHHPRDPFVTQAAWYRKSRNLLAEFVHVQGRDPDEGEKKGLQWYVRNVNSQVQHLDETNFEYVHRLITYFIHNLHVAPKKIQKRLWAQAEGAVANHVAIYHSHHKSAFESIGDFIVTAAKTAGRAAHALTHAVHDATGAIADLAGKVPFVGPGLHAVFDAALVGPFDVADGVMSGKRLDHVLVDRIKADVQNVKDVAPYAQMALSVVPGIGSGVNAVIGGGLALASGKRIDEALVQGLRDAAPGGKLGSALLDVGHAAMTGKPIDEVALAAVPLPDEQKKLLAEGLHATHAIARGDNVASTALSEATRSLPPEAREALQVGMAVGHGQKLQEIARSEMSSSLVQGALQSVGVQTIAANPTLTAAADTVKHTDKTAFEVATGLMQHKGVTPVAVAALRRQYQGSARKAFDAALAVHIGRVTTKPPGHLTTPEAKAGYYMVRGIQTGAHAQKKAILKLTEKNPGVMKGAVQAAHFIAVSQHGEGTLWEKIVIFVKKLNS